MSIGVGNLEPQVQGIGCGRSQGQVESIAIGGAEIEYGGESAAGDLRALLNVLPANVIRARLDLQAAVEQALLGADLVTPQRIGIVGSGELAGEVVLRQRLLAGGLGVVDLRVDAAD